MCRQYAYIRVSSRDQKVEYNQVRKKEAVEE